jgi:hypothetical protein
VCSDHQQVGRCCTTNRLALAPESNHCQAQDKATAINATVAVRTRRVCIVEGRAANVRSVIRVGPVSPLNRLASVST